MYLKLSKSLQKWLSRNKDSGLLGVYSLDTVGIKGKGSFLKGERWGILQWDVWHYYNFLCFMKNFFCFCVACPNSCEAMIARGLDLHCCCCVAAVSQWSCLWGFEAVVIMPYNRITALFCFKTFTDVLWLFLYYDQLQQGAGSCDWVFRQVTLFLLLVLGTFSNTYRWHYLQFPKYFKNSKNQVQESLHMNRKWHSNSQYSSL